MLGTGLLGIGVSRDKGKGLSMPEGVTGKPSCCQLWLQTVMPLLDGKLTLVAGEG